MANKKNNKYVNNVIPRNEKHHMIELHLNHCEITAAYDH